jgi:hypothetical protein
MKKILTWISDNRLLLVIALFILVLLTAVRGCIKEKQNANQLSEAIKDRDAKVSYWKDENGKLHAQVQQVQASKDQIEVLYKNKLDSVSHELNIKPKQITDYTEVTKKTSGNFTTKVDTVWKIETVKGDSIKVVEYVGMNYTDKWIDFHGKLKDNSFTASYSIKDSISIVGYWKRTGFLGLGKKDYVVDISSANPNTSITNAKNFKVTSSVTTPIGVGFIGGYGWNGQKFSPFIGVGLYYKIF